MARIPVGAQRWEGFHVVCKPLELGGIDRRLFGLMMIVLMVFWQGMGSFLLGAGSTALLYMFFRRLTKSDPQFFSVLRLAARLPAAWYDPATLPTEYGPYIASDPDVVRRYYERVRREAAVKQTGWRRRVIDLVALLPLGRRGSSEGDT